MHLTQRSSEDMDQAVQSILANYEERVDNLFRLPMVERHARQRKLRRRRIAATHRVCDSVQHTLIEISGMLHPVFH